MAAITVKFVDFWSTWDGESNFIVDALRSRHSVTVLTGRDAVPDILFYSALGYEHLRYDCVKVYFTGENDVPDFNECDYALSPYYIDFDGRHLRYPLWAQDVDFRTVAAGKAASPTDDDALNRGFCSLVVSNFRACDPMRVRVIEAVDSYKTLASGGRFRNNVGGPVANKMEFIAKYKFNLAAENSSAPGYTTEKLVEPMAAGTVPIYWGNPLVGTDFNKEAFIDLGDYSSTESAVKAIAAIDNDSQAYLKMLRAPKLRADQQVDWDTLAADFLCPIADNPQKRRLTSGIQLTRHLDLTAAHWLYDKPLLRKIARFNSPGR